MATLTPSFPSPQQQEADYNKTLEVLHTARSDALSTLEKYATATDEEGMRSFKLAQKKLESVDTSLEKLKPFKAKTPQDYMAEEAEFDKAEIEGVPVSRTFNDAPQIVAPTQGGKFLPQVSLDLNPFTFESVNPLTEAPKPTYVDLPNTAKVKSMAAAASVNGSYDDARLMANELELDGKSLNLEKIQDLITSDTNQERTGALQAALTAEGITNEEAETLLVNYLVLRTERPDMKQHFIEAVAAIDQSETATEAEIQDTVTEEVDRVLEVQDELQNMANGVMAAQNAEAGGAFADFLGIMVPFVEQENVADFKKALGLETGFFEFFFQGSQKKQIVKALAAMPPDKRLQASQALLNAINTESGLYLNDNGMAKMHYIEDLLKEGGYPEWRVWLDNMIGILDLVGLGGVAKHGLRKIGQMRAAHIVSNIHPGSPAGIAAQTNPRVAGSMLADALYDETGEVAKAIGVTKTDIVGSVMPKPVGYNLEGAPDSVIQRMQHLDQIADDLYRRTGTHGLVFKEDEIAAIWERAEDVVQNISGLTYRQGMSTFAPDKHSFVINAVYGSNEAAGWKSAKAAKAAATRTLGKDQPVNILVRDPASNQVFDAASKEGKRLALTGGDYYIQFAYKHAYDPQVVSSLGSDAMSWLDKLPYVGKYLADASSRFGEIIRNGALQYADKASGIEKQLINISTHNIKVLKNKSRAKVFNAIETGYKEEKNYSYQDLVTKFGMDDPEEILAYFSFRRGEDIKHQLHNREIYNDLTVQGYQSLYVGSKDTGMFAKAIPEESVMGGARQLHVYDPAEDTAKVLSAEEISHLYESGGSVARLNQPVHMGADKFSYVLTGSSPYKGGATVLKPLRRNPLSYKNGYYQRFYDETYYVKKIYLDGKIDGRVIPTDMAMKGLGSYETVAAVSRKTDAEEMVMQQINKNTDEGVTYIYQPARELQTFSKEQADWSMMQTNGLVSGKRRGDRLTGFNGELAAIDDPLQAMVRSSRALSQKVAMGTWHETMKQRWLKSYGHLLNGDEKLFPNNVGAIREQGRALGAPSSQINQAVSLFEYIKMMENAPTPLSKVWQSTALWLAEVTEGVPLLSKAFRSQKQANPIRALKGTSYQAFIALNPLRQALIQPSQILQMLAIDPKYMFGGVQKDLGALALGMQGFTQAGAKMMGISHAEFNQLVKQFADSGLPYAVDSNLLIEGAVKAADASLQAKGVAAQVALGPVEVLKNMAHYSKKVGFDAGEWMNLAAHWLVARRRWIKRNPNKQINSIEAVEEIALDARQMSYSMNRGGKMGYQGYPTSVFSEALSIPLQFFSVPHKAFLSMTGSKHYTKAEKLRLLGANLVLFGGAGVGFAHMNGMLDAVRDAFDLQIADEDWVWIKGGLIDWGLSEAVNHVVENDRDFEDTFKFSKNISPTAGGPTPLIEIIEQLGTKPFYTALGGAAGNVGSRVMLAVDEITSLMENPRLDTDEKIARAMSSIAAISGAGTNYYKAKVAMITGKLHTSTGQPYAETTHAGAWMQMLGITTAKGEELWETVKDTSDWEKDVRKEVKDRFYTPFRSLMMKSDMPEDEFMQQLEFLKYQLIPVMEYEDERRIAVDEFQRLGQQDLKNTGTSVQRMYIQRIFGTGGGTMKDKLFNRVEGSTHFTDEQKAKIRKLITTVTTGAE